MSRFTFSSSYRLSSHVVITNLFADDVAQFAKPLPPVPAERDNCVLFVQARSVGCGPWPALSLALLSHGGRATATHQP